ncbi:IS66 family transposase [uncultured Paraglaciecola sp.]|uniref:IS66 family transposase n=1 Tax=uncultured Paraglaciecola sp. TaxID=1765024 RepID=UPI00260C868F|nr:IS66 family transposase [uncultured Paraglaciecola sp.]
MIETQYQQRITELESLLAEKDAKIAFLEEQFRLAQQKQFGASSEGHPGQGELFNEVEAEVEQLDVEPVQETIGYTRNKPKRKPLPKDLPREVVVIDIADEDKVCACCNGELHQIGEDKSEKLEFIPAKVKVIETVRPKYACRACEKDGTQNQIKQAPVPASIIPKGYATPSLLSQIITSKYQYGLPLYRQESLFKQYGIELSRKTMADWMIKSQLALQILYERLREILLQQSVIQADETTLKVIGEAKTTSYMWLYCSGTDSPNDSSTPNIVLYDYQNSRRGQCAVDFLAGYSGYLQVDGYQGYAQTQATLVACMAHARRKFVEAETAQPKGKTGKANWALNQIQKLYRIETKIKGKTAQEKYRIRQADALPLLMQFKGWLDKSATEVPPKTALGKALAYSLNQWSKLIRYIEDGNLTIDNNRAERAIKPFVIGRKNWLFSNTANGANASATLYSIIETAKSNGLVPFDYLNHLLNEIPSLKPDDTIEHLLPWNCAKR